MSISSADAGDNVTTPCVLNEALRLAKLGYYVAPVKVWLDDKCVKRMTRLPWSKMSTRDEATIRGWFAAGGRYADHDLLIDCGKSGIVVVDLDEGDGKSGAAEWKRLGGPSSKMVTLTRSGGHHGFYKADPQRPVRNSAGEVARGIDVRGIGGMVFAPPTVVGNEGGAYSWLSGPVAVADLAPAPTHLLTIEGDSAVTRVATGGVLSSGGADQVLRDAEKVMLDAVEGENWNASLNHLAFVTGRYCGAVGESEDDAYERVVKVTGQRADAADGLDEESERTALRAIRQGIASPWELSEVEDLIDWEAQGVDPKEVGVMAESPGEAFLSQLLTTRQLRELPPPEYLIDKILPAQGLVQVFGASGSFKSFYVLDLVAHVGTGLDSWCGFKVKQAESWVIVAEGVSGTPKRAAAWELHHGREMTGVYFLPRPAQLLGKEMKEIIEAARIRKPGVITFDTQARSTVGVQENDAKEMGEVIHACELLREASGGTVILVHHSGYENGHARGSTAIRGALTTQIEITRKSMAVTVDVKKQKDDVEIKGVELTAITVDTDIADEDGSPVSSLVLVPGTGPATRTDPEQPPDDVEIGTDVELYSGPGAKLVPSLARWMAWNAVGGVGRSKSEAQQAIIGRKTTHGTFNRAWDALVDLGALEPDKGANKVGRSHWIAQGERP